MKSILTHEKQGRTGRDRRRAWALRRSNRAFAEMDRFRPGGLRGSGFARLALECRAPGRSMMLERESSSVEPGDGRRVPPCDNAHRMLRARLGRPLPAPEIAPSSLCTAPPDNRRASSMAVRAGRDVARHECSTRRHALDQCATRARQAFIGDAPCSVLCALCSVLRAPCSVLRAPCSVLRAPCPVFCALARTPSQAEPHHATPRHATLTNSFTRNR